MVHFQEGNDRSAQVVSRIAEEIYGPITELYEHEPDEKLVLYSKTEKTIQWSRLLFDNKIDIGFCLRCPLTWYAQLDAKRYYPRITHIIQLQVGLKRARRTPATYLQWLSYEKCADPMYFTDFLMALLPCLLPRSTYAWLAEGTAQYQRKELSYDKWDAHRDMVLRNQCFQTAILIYGNGTFASKTSLNEKQFTIRVLPLLGIWPKTSERSFLKM